MKSELKRIFSITRNERIGLVCITIIAVCIITFAMCSKEEHGTTIETPQSAIELATALDSAKTDTIPRKKRKKKDKNKKTKIIHTISSLEEVQREQ